jgi:hypothetical protein
MPLVEEQHGERPRSDSSVSSAEMRALIASLERQLEQQRQANSEQLSLLAAALKRIPLQPEAAPSKRRRLHTMFTFLRNFARENKVDSTEPSVYSPFWPLMKVLLLTYVVGVFLVWVVASIGAYSALRPEDAALYLPPGTSLLVAWAFGIYAGSRDSGWKQFPWFSHFVAAVTALGATFLVIYVSNVAQGVSFDHMWMFPIRKDLVRLKVFISIYLVFVFGTVIARALVNIAKDSKSGEDSSNEAAASGQEFQAWLAFAGTIITAILSLVGGLVT